MSPEILELLKETVERRASDLHLTPGVPPQVRIDGTLLATDRPVLSPEKSRELSFAMLDEKRIARLEAERGLDTSFSVEGLGRFRLNVFYQRGTVASAVRHLPWEIPTMEELGVPPIMKEFCERLSGLVLVSGPTGSGKSTTLASMISHINAMQCVHIVSVEDPIEYLHRHKCSIINQREIGRDTVSFADAVRQVLRQDPDVICIGEIRDLETVRTALTLAETGHLVLTTVHTSEAPQAISRILDIFPPHEQQGVRTQISLCLEGVLVQQLLPDACGTGRVLATELMVATPAVRNLIRENNLQQLRSAIETGSKEGMHSLNSTLVRLVRKKRITPEVAVGSSNDVKGILRDLGRLDLTPHPAAHSARRAM
ncbi:MAG: PilT/PilU family type 4a pilus ATPase [Candidatus Eisenbacteria bacterium]|nr:PilT/PilU family type 4a pilus ATPase [Candidatus Eisenbacteria bacterium]